MVCLVVTVVFVCLCG